MRYEGTVHEQLVGVARGQVDVVRADFMHFRHDGHTAKVLATRNKDERNLSLARAQVTAATQDPFAWFCLGQALLTVSARDRQEQALVAFAQAVAHLNASHEGEAFVVSLFSGYAHTLKLMGQNDDALQLLNAAISAFPGSPDLHLMRGNLLVAATQLHAAEADFRSCLSEEAKTFFVRLNPGAIGYEARVGLGLCLLKQGKIEEAKLRLLEALGQAPANDTRATSLLAAIGNR
jgi:tetratricopeptide (TPR) repeat protein